MTFFCLNSSISDITEVIAHSLQCRLPSDMVVLGACGNGGVSLHDSFEGLTPQCCALKDFAEGVIDAIDAMNSKVKAYFQTLFGSDRVSAVAERYDIASLLSPKARAVTKRDVEKLFLGIADVRLDDISAIFQAIKRDRFIGSVEAKGEVKRHFEGKYFSDLTKGDVDFLMQLAIPFKKIEHIFLNNLPDIKGGEGDSGRSFRGKRLGVLLREELRRERDNLTSTEWIVRMSKRIVTLEPPAGTVFAHKDGYYAVHDTVHGGGAYKMFCKAITANSDLLNMVIYRGTRIYPTACGWFQSLENNMSRRPGYRGSQKTEEVTRKYFTSVQEGFIDNDCERITLVGYSLGGAHAQRDSVLFAEHIKAVTLVAPVGVERELVEIFRKKREECVDPISIEYITEEGDIFSKFGERHIGFGSSPKEVAIRHITLYTHQCRGMENGRTMKQNRCSDLASRIFEMMRSFCGPHTIEVIGHEAHGEPLVIDNSTEEGRDCIDRILDNTKDEDDRRWDSYRRTLGRMLLRIINTTQCAASALEGLADTCRQLTPVSSQRDLLLKVD